MPKVVRSRSLHSYLWPSLVAGAALGAVVIWLALRPRVHEPADADEQAALAARLQAWPGAEGLRIRSLGNGICELVGSAAEGLDLAALIRALEAEPGVGVVVSRVWTPASGGAA